MDEQSQIFTPKNLEQIEYFVFYKSIDKSSKIEPKLSQLSEDDQVLQKNLKMMLKDIDDLSSLKQ